MAEQYKYDVAFSFLSGDEPLAVQLNDRLQDRVKTFIYTEQQKVVAGTDGEETYHRVFGNDARTVVVLYRNGWGESGWTRIEQTAIRNRGHEHGYEFTVFVPLDVPPQVPKWLPAAQIWVDYSRFGLDGAAAVIQARIQGAGGQVHQETVEEHAQRLSRAMAFDKRRAAFQREPGVQAAQEQIAELTRMLQSGAARVKDSTPIRLELIQQPGGWKWLVGLGRALGVQWKQTYSNTLDAAELQVELFDHLPPGPGQWMFEKPSRLKSFRFSFDLLPSDVGGWVARNPTRTFSTEALAEHLIKFYLENGRNR